MSFVVSGLRVRKSRILALGLLLFLVAVFALSAWKIANRLSPSSFAAALPNAALPSSSAGDVGNVAQKPGLPPNQTSADGRPRFDAGFISSAAGQAVHAASLVELGDGGLRAVWFSGSREGAGDVVIKTSVMDAASLRWSEETTLFDLQRIQQDLWRYVRKLGNPVIARAPDGSLWLWMVNVSLGGWAGSSITWARSTDDGVHWSVPHRLVTSPFLNISTLVKGTPFFYQDGQIGLPVYHEFLTKFAEVLRIDPDGHVVDKYRVPASHNSLQPVVLPTTPQRAQMYLRSGDRIAVMRSDTSDAGKTWSPAQATRWPNPDSALAGVVTAGGQQWLALNPTASNRETLALLHSPAGGSFDSSAPWVVEAPVAPEKRLTADEHERLLGDELRMRGASDAQVAAYVASARRQLCANGACSLEFSYPYLLQSGDGHLHLAYTWHRTRIKHVRLDPLQRLQIDAARASQKP